MRSEGDPIPLLKSRPTRFKRQIQECIDAGLVLDYRDGDYPQHCSPCFLVAKPGSTGKRLVVDYREMNKKTLNHSGSIPNMESTLEKIASCRYKTKMDKRSGFWQVDLTPNGKELLAFITPQGRVLKWKVMPFGVANCSRIGFSRCFPIHVVVLAAHSSMLALLYLWVSLVFDYRSWIPAFIP